MATRVDMPQLGLTMEQGTVLKWLKREGDEVRKGEPLVMIQTEKVEYEMESPGAGVLRKILAGEGTDLPVGAPLGILGTADEEISALVAGAAGAKAPAAGPAPAPTGQSAGVAAPTRAPGEKVKISPAARKMAEEHGIPIASLTGTGPEGRIVREDVERAIAAGPGAGAVPPAAVEAAAARRIPLSGIRKVIFDRMGESWRTAARVTLVAEADLTGLMALRRERLPQWEREWGIKVTASDLIHQAVAAALRDQPRVNCRLDGQEIRVEADVHLAFAVDLGEGLVAPVIKNADRKSLAELAREARDLAERARAGRLLPDDLAGGTFTVTNLGAYGVDLFTPVINQPQGAILGVGRIAEKPVVRDGGIHIRTMMALCLVFDHRLVDGAPAARFLARVKDLLENPGAWVS